MRAAGGVACLYPLTWLTGAFSGPFCFFSCVSDGDLSPLELADVNGDGLRDVLLSFVASRNRSSAGKGTASRGCCSRGALRKVRGEHEVTTRWSCVITLLRKCLSENKAQFKEPERGMVGKRLQWLPWPWKKLIPRGSGPSGLLHWPQQCLDFAGSAQSILAAS